MGASVVAIDEQAVVRRRRRQFDVAVMECDEGYPSHMPGDGTDEGRDPLIDLESALVAATRASQALTIALERAATALGAMRAPTPVPKLVPEPPRSGRRALRLPSGMNVDTIEGASWILAATRAMVVVDGYDVAEVGWPAEPLAQQREQLLGVLDDLVCRNAVDAHVVFDGAETGPVRAGGNRQASASFSRPEAHAVDEIRSRVQAVPATRPVIVVTDDAAVAHEAWADGANVLGSRLFLAVVGHPVVEKS
jgi:predicted RNA-binding protein with PIN domain